MRALMLAAALLLVPAPVAAQPTDLCVRVGGTQPAGGWTRQSLAEALAEGHAVVIGVEDAGNCAGPPDTAAPAAVPAATAAPAGVPATSSGNWLVGPIKRDPVTDAPTAITILEATSGSDQVGNPISIAIRCAEGSTDLIVSWQDYLGSDGSVDVTTRVGDKDPKTFRWGTSTDSDATFYPRDPVGFIQSLFDEIRLVLRTMPYNAGPSTAEFDLTGIEGAVVNVRQACGW